MMETSMAESALQLSGASSPKPMKPTRPSMTPGAEVMLRFHAACVLIAPVFARGRLIEIDR